METLIKHKFLNSVLFTALFVPLGFFLPRDTIAAITGIMFESIGGNDCTADGRRYYLGCAQ